MADTVYLASREAFRVAGTPQLAKIGIIVAADVQAALLALPDHLYLDPTSDALVPEFKLEPLGLVDSCDTGPLFLPFLPPLRSLTGEGVTGA